MKKLISLILALVMAMSLSTVAFAEEEKVVNVFTWEGYINSDTQAAFTAATGIKVNFSPFSSNEEMMSKLQMNGGSEYDVIIASDYAMNTLRKQELLMKLDKAQLTNYDNLNPDYLSQYYDPDNEYVIPYTAGTPLIVYDKDQVSIDIKGYADLWDESLADNVVLIDDARNIVGITLKTMGKSFNETDPAVLAEAKEKLMPLYKNVRVFDYDTPYTALLNGEVAVSYMFTPFVIEALKGNPDLTVVHPEEGLGFGIDGLVIPVNAPHPNAAHQLLNYLMDAQVAANTATYQMYMNPNKAAEEYLPEEYLNNPAFVTSEEIANAEFIQDLGETESIFQDIWNSFKQQ